MNCVMVDNGAVIAAYAEAIVLVRIDIERTGRLKAVAVHILSIMEKVVRSDEGLKICW
jgi:hypothetical protein